MRLIIFSVILLGSFTLAGAAPQFVLPRTPLEARPGDLQAFYGQVKAIDRSAHTITLGMPMRFVFHVPASTQITIRKGGPASLDAIKPGAGVQITARRDAKGWTALKIALALGARFPEEISARTVQGKIITGLDVASFIIYEPPGEIVNRNIDFGQRSGLFLLTLLPDGTVASARPIKSLGLPELDERATKRLLKMKFRPGALSEARVPVNFHTFRRY